MIYLVLAVLCSVAVSVFLKLMRGKSIQIEQAIAMNYVVASALTWFLLNPNLSTIKTDETSIALFTALGILLPTVFVFMSRAVRYAGIIKSDAAQRLALFIPILASFTIFGEVLTQTRMIGLVLAFAALICLVYKSNHNKSSGSTAQIVGSLLAVWLGYGVIDVLFKQVAKSGSATPANLFAAFVLSGVLIFAYLLLKRIRWSSNTVLAGVLLGVLNFGNIWFYIRAHQVFSTNPTLVFAGMNIGVITLGTLVGAFAFREKISRINLIGVVLAIAAIVCLFYGVQVLAWLP
jgi:drug/metabolite transporter (DMT)-like permease